MTVFVFTTFDVICDLILNIHKAEWNLVGRVISLISRAVFFFPNGISGFLQSCCYA